MGEGYALGVGRSLLERPMEMPVCRPAWLAHGRGRALQPERPGSRAVEPPAPPLPAAPPQSTSGAAANSERLHQESELAIKQVQSDVAASKATVVDMLLKYATNVTL